MHGMILDVVVDVDTRNVHHYYWFGCLDMMLDICSFPTKSIVQVRMIIMKEKMEGNR